MSPSKSSGTQNRQSARDSEEEVAKKRSGSADKSAVKSADEKSRARAGTGKGAGGGAKQKQGH